MDTAATDDNFFIEEPQKLRNNFFNKDKSLQMVELLAQKHHVTLEHQQQQQQKRRQIDKIQTYRLSYNNNKKLQQLQQIQQEQLHLQLHAATMPKSYITRLDILCQATFNTDDINLAKRAVDTLVSASKSGCCFLERYIVMLVNFCTRDHQLADETMKIKVEELLDRVLCVHFDRQQLTENLKRPEYKLSSIEHMIQLLKRVQDMLDYRERIAIDWLSVLLDAYFVELATNDEAADIIDQISAHINFQCALLRETETTKCLLKSIFEQLDETTDSTGEFNHKGTRSSKTNVNNKQLSRHKRPYYSIELIEF